jgi:hypothetical protein
MAALDELQNIIEREDVRRCTVLKSLLGLPLIAASELKADLKADLKPELKAGKVIDLAAKFKEIAEKMAGASSDPRMI